MLDEKRLARHERGMPDFIRSSLKFLGQGAAWMARTVTWPLRFLWEALIAVLREHLSPRAFADRAAERFFYMLFLFAFVVVVWSLAWLAGRQGDVAELNQDAIQLSYWLPNCDPGLAKTCPSPNDVAELIRNLFFAIAGLVGALFGLFQLHNSAKRTRISGDQARIAFEAERNERFVKAAQLLKEDSPAVQMAAINAFQRLALEDRANYRETVIRVLAGFIRAETGPFSELQRNTAAAEAAAALADDEDSAQPQGDENPSPASTPADETHPEQPVQPTEPVAEALKALSVLTRVGLGHADQIKMGKLVDLRSCQLDGMDHPGGHCAGWNFQGAKLRQANLGLAQLQKANLEGAQLQKAKLEGAQLQKAKLGGAQLQKANLLGVDLVFTSGVKTEQLAQALNVTWPDHVPRPAEGKYSKAWEAEQAAKWKAALSPDDSEGETQGPEAS